MNNTPRALAPRRSSRTSTPRFSRWAALSAASLVALPVLVHPAAAQPAADAAPADVAGAAIANGAATARSTAPLPGEVRLTLAVGGATQLQLPADATYYVLSGRDNLALEAHDGVLEVTPQKEGRAQLIIAAPGEPERSYDIRIAAGAGNAAPLGAPPAPVGTASAVGEFGSPGDGTGAATGVAVGSAAIDGTATVLNGTTVDNMAADNTAALPEAAPPPAPSTANGPQVTIDDVALPAPPAPGAEPGAAPANLPAPGGMVDIPQVPATPQLLQETQPIMRREVSLGSLPRPATGEEYPTLHLTQGMAKLIPTGENVLAVFFSNDNVMDARAINARTIAITGKEPGQSTLAIFKARDKKDVVGEAEVYTVQVGPPSPLGEALAGQTPESLQAAISAAIGDPRIETTVFSTPGGGYVVRLKGTVRDAAEKSAAERIVELFGLQSASAIYVDSDAPTIEQYGMQPPPTRTPLEQMQDQLRSITGNASVELIPWPTGTVLKATVDSPAEAEQMLSLVSGIGQRVTSLIRVRGQAGEASVYQSSVPQLSPEDAAMTRRMQSVLNIPTVYAVRTAFNAVAVTGTVRTRSEYDRVKRYASVLPQVLGGAGGVAPGSAPGAVEATGAGAALATGDQGTSPVDAVRDLSGLGRSVAPGTGYQFPTQIQMFVRITDPAEAQIRQVTVDTSVVEISRNGLKDLGVEVGSASVTSEVIDAAGGVTREIDPTFQNGQLQAGNGFGGTGGFGFIDPIRVRLNALIQNGDARILSNPNLTMLEGAEAQLIVGGQRPIIKTTTNLGNVTQDIEFRPFGIILTARPTVGADDTITLQVRANVTELDFTSSIVVGGAEIPGERTRSVDTTVALKPGDTLVMGGLISTEHRKEFSRVPLLSNIPILGKLFQSKRFVNNETELAIFMTPSLQRVSVEDLNVMLDHPRLPELRSADGAISNGDVENRGAGTGIPAQGPR